MINVSSAEYVNKTSLELIENETKKRIYGDLFTQPFILVINGKSVAEDLYEKTIINEDDEIKIVPLYSGG